MPHPEESTLSALPAQVARLRRRQRALERLRTDPATGRPRLDPDGRPVADALDGAR